jgi:hypothetical protein
MFAKASWTIAIAVGLVAFSNRAAADTMFDLSTAGSSATINGAIYTQGDIQSAGTGVFMPFLRIQNTPTEEGFNTDFRPLPMDDVKSDPHTHSLNLGDMGLVNINGTHYREFHLDLNQVQSTGSSLISLDKVQIFLGSAPDLNNYPNLGTLIFDQGANWVLLDSMLSHGSGQSDMSLDVPDSLFTGPNQWVYLYSHFGDHNASNDGFEEWAANTPEPSTMVLAGIAMCAAPWLVRRKRPV